MAKKNKNNKKTIALMPAERLVSTGPDIDLRSTNYRGQRRLRQLEADDLLTMLTYRRPAWSATEEQFIARYLDPISGMQMDEYGNRMLIHPTSRTMISCHTDTVHRVGGRQRVVEDRGTVFLDTLDTDTFTNSTCLGADDTAGIYAAIRMIQAGVPVSFVFHRAEEIGGQGSDWLAKYYPGWLGRFDRCVALDRRGYGDIIEYQSWHRCCSRTFASALGEAIGMGQKPADGVFTDSANYTDLIAECSNVSVGYGSEHTVKESLDADYLERLVGKLVAVDWDGLPVSRKPGERESAFLSLRSEFRGRLFVSGLDSAYGDDDQYVECGFCLETVDADEVTLMDGYYMCLDCQADAEQWEYEMLKNVRLELENERLEVYEDEPTDDE